MTIICAITDGERTWIGSDTRTTFGHGEFMDGTAKWHRAGPWWIGAAGLNRAHLVIHSVRGRLAKLGAVAACNEIRRACREDGWQSNSQPGECPGFDLSLILARAGKVWMTDAGLTPHQVPAWRLAAGGGGERYAMGAAFALRHVRRFATRPDLIVPICLQAAIAHNTGCGGEPWVKTLTRRVGGG